MEERLARYYAFLKKNWNSILAGFSLVGFLVFFYIPPLREYSFWFAFLAANAIIWTLVELKVRLFSVSPSTRYPDMRDARPDIIRRMEDAMSKGHREPLRICIIGGRIRTISDMLREIKNDILSGRLQTSNVSLSVCCIDPKFLCSWTLAGLRDPGGFSKKCARYANMIDQFSSELHSYNTLDAFVTNSISVEVFHYRCFPSFYAFLIGASSLYWGFFTWNQEIEDFEGPENPCFFLDSRMDSFSDLHSWLANRAEFLQTCIGSKYGETVGKTNGE